MTESVYDAAGGRDGLLRLAHAWHDRCLADPIAAHPFERPGHPQHLERLAAYLGEALGGPQTYTESMADHAHVLRLHACNGEHREMDEAAIACWEQALDDCGYAGAVRDALSSYFAWGVALMASNPHSADAIRGDEPLPHWSWDGPQR